LAIGQTVRMTVVLHPAGVVEEVSVTVQLPPLDARQTSVATVIETERIEPARALTKLPGVRAARAWRHTRRSAGDFGGRDVGAAEQRLQFRGAPSPQPLTIDSRQHRRVHGFESDETLAGSRAGIRGRREWLAFGKRWRRGGVDQRRDEERREHPARRRVRARSIRHLQCPGKRFGHHRSNVLPARWR